MRITLKIVAYVIIVYSVTISLIKPSIYYQASSEQDLMFPSSPLLYSSLVETIAAKASQDRYIILALVDGAFTDMAMNFHESSLGRHHIDNYLFVGVGKFTCDVLRRQSLSCSHYVDDPAAGVASEFGGRQFIRKMNIRTEMILEALTANFTVVHSDLDVSFLANPLYEIQVSNQIKSNLFNKRTTRPLTLQYKQYTLNTIGKSES